MKINLKFRPAYKTIGEVAKELDLIDKKTGQLQTHTIRYWETQFKQIKPSLLELAAEDIIQKKILNY